jgi:hypothetical protein
MSFRQTYKGIFQFKDQATLERAMFENQAEAMGADAMGLQECYHSPGVMLIDIDTKSSLQDWEEMAVAIATLAMHASMGFCYALAYDGGLTGPRSEYFRASGEPLNSVDGGSALKPEDDFFPFQVGTSYEFAAHGLGEYDQVVWTVNELMVGKQSFPFLKDATNRVIHFNDFWEGTYFRKRGALVDLVLASDEDDLMSMDFEDRYTFQQVYSSNSEVGDTHYAIWMDGDHFLQFTVEAFEDLELPIGKLAGCMKVRMDLYHVMGSRMFHEVQHQYMAKGYGLVKWEKGDASLALRARF